jgi:pimeloyl-ACP methyl ester carboxylesterase
VPVGGAVLESGFTSARDVARELYRFLPVRLVMRSRFDTLAHVPRIDAPVLILHSQDDEFFGIAHAERLRAAARAARLVTLRGGHNDAFLVSEDRYREALGTFLASLPDRGTGQS